MRSFAEPTRALAVARATLQPRGQQITLAARATKVRPPADKRCCASFGDERFVRPLVSAISKDGRRHGGARSSRGRHVCGSSDASVRGLLAVSGDTRALGPRHGLARMAIGAFATE